MWIDEQIWGHRLWDTTNPWLIFLELLGVAEAKDREQSLFDDGGQPYPLRFKPAQRMYVRNILYNNEPLLRIAEEGLADGAAWEKWLTAMAERAQAVPVRDFSYLRKRFSSFSDFVAMVSMLRGTTIENGSNKRWSSRFVFPFGRHALYEDLNVKNNSASREYINFGLPGELAYQMLCRSGRAGELAPEIAQMLDGDPCDQLLRLLEPDYEEDKSTRGNSYLPYATHQTFKDLADDWLALLRGPLPRFDTYPHLAALTCLHLLRYQLLVAAEYCFAGKPHFICEVLAPRRTPVRELSISNFQMNDTLPSRAVDAYIDAIGRSEEWKRRQSGETPFADCRRLLVDTVRWPGEDDYNGPPDENALLVDLKRAAQARHRQHVAAVHRSYGAGCGLVSRRGTNQLRYAPTDALLKSLILTNVPTRMDYSEFLDLLYRRYGLVIGEREAVQVLSDDEFDRKSFQLNSARLERRLRTLGMLRRLGDGAAAAIVAPWHPLRLAATWRKAHLVREVVRSVIDLPGGLEGDTKLFFRDLAEDMRHVFYPEVVVSWTGRKPELLVLVDSQGDYSLHERPVLEGEGGGETNDDATAGSKCLLDLTQRYLNLHPHERANMSLVLYNCDSARLPQQIVEGLGDLNDDEDMRCQVMLRHTHGERLRDIYRSILTSASNSPEVLAASEVTQDFMARLRISVIADQAPPPDARDGRPYDIVFSQDVISRHASVEWYRESADPADIATLLPARWSRRRPGAMDDLKSCVYLCSPVQSREGWAHLSALTSFFKSDEGDHDGKRLLPVRQLDFRDARTARIFEETHDLGAWVVNFDELLDRRQLQNQSVRVIRYKQSSTQGRNVVISSRAPLNLLHAMVRRRLEELQLAWPADELNVLAERFIADANDISGDIVLRAAKRGEAAGELIGVVLSRFLARQSLESDRLVGWYFLDDYASWLGAREETQADILVLSPALNEAGQLVLRILVTEAKYVDAVSYTAKRKESEKQLRDTVRRIIDATAEPNRLDRDSWLSRLGDLLLDGIQVPASSNVPLTEWRRIVRDGVAKIEIVGFSHVFVPTALDTGSVTDFSEVAGVPASRQMVFGRTELKALLGIYAANGSAHGLLTSIDPIYGKMPSPHGGVGSTASKWVSSRGISPVSSTNKGEKPAVHEPQVPVEEEKRAAASPPAAAERTVASVIQGHASTGNPADTEPDERWLANTALMTRSALQQLGLQAKLIDQKLTPNAAILRFSGSANITVEQVLKRRSELLTTHKLDVISVRPEPGAIAIYIARSERQIVDIQSLWKRWNPTVSPTGAQNILIGVREDSNELFFLSPSQRHAPHTLIAGSTGSGKSVLMQSIILGIAATNDPRHARIVLIDPKQGVDYFAFDALPHLDGGIIDQQEAAVDRLERLVQEMDNRYRLLKEARAPNITAYNAKVAAADVLPTYWVIHDEFAEWMLTDEYRAAVTSTVGRLGVKARAAGIHLIFAAQRPEANVMPMQLRSQLGNRLILRVDSEGTSEIALGERGAERLLGKGHMIIRAEGEQSLIYAQVPFAPEGFISDVVEALQAQHQIG